MKLCFRYDGKREILRHLADAVGIDISGCHVELWSVDVLYRRLVYLRTPVSLNILRGILSYCRICLS